MTNAGCAGVGTLHGQVVLFTGKTFMNGVWETKKTCGRVAKQNGAIWVENESRKVTLVPVTKNRSRRSTPAFGSLTVISST